MHSPAIGKEKRATWLELFYDLIFVAAFIQLGNGLSNHVDVRGFLEFAAIFTPMWVAWTGFTFYVNRFTIDDFTHRILVMVQMFAVGAMAMTAPAVLDGEHRLFSLCYAIAQLIIAILYWRSWRQVEEGRAFSRYWGRVFFVGSVIWCVSAFVPSPWSYVLWGLGIAEILAAPFRSASRALEEQYPLDHEHLAERYGLLTLIVLGESFVKVLGGVTTGQGQLGPVFQASFILLITCSLWWIYFDDVAGSRIKKRRLAPLVWLYAHLPLQLGLVATGVGIKKAVNFDVAAIAPDKYRWLLAGSLAVVLASVAIIDSVTERRQAELSDANRVRARALSSIFILLLAPAGVAMVGWQFLGVIMLVCAAQVVFDMMMAPFEAEDEHVKHLTIADEVRQGKTTFAAPSRPALTEAVRKGTPSELRRDVYFYLMEGSWSRVLVFLSFLYLVGNLFFAALYLLEPGSIGGAASDSFGDAFFFSVQTMSTIGYGAMSPASDYGHMVVTVESAAGLLGVALATGLMFAKASRPRASILFSNCMVKMTRHGVPTLVFRAGNARGNEVVDASISVSVLCDELSPEGHHLRRLHDLRLVRKRTPVFTLTWVVMHEIDDDSPLAHVDWSKPADSVLLFVVSMTGHDGTYGETIYARHNYYPGDIRVGHRFVDVISELPDGRLMIDYTRFHETIEDGVDG